MILHQALRKQSISTWAFYIEDLIKNIVVYPFPKKKKILNLYEIYLRISFFCSDISLFSTTLHSSQKDAFCGRPIEAKRKSAEGCDVVKN